ncbi:MAG: HD domain-containing protein [Gemmatimonadales bacterium]|nr:HD domain-containing protein [Gemmatimonadales bacterium]NIN12987.1 HD domain-containing protein [Gemmatimonadales bacterium]NIN51064.1 HD domain-containing protein [Gemmatimonadales bacterium]NIP08528.1 HD domain-containing protein [Gemmatimonadales bacterium]NIR02246.1 HD domain-containing protein [Gemmatimonadales bacterium]
MRPRLAAIDVGTNSIRLVVAEVEPDGSYRVLDEEVEMTRLGRGLYTTGRIGRGPMERSLLAVGKMRAIADGFGVQQLRVVATSAVREASNGEVFRREAKRRFGVGVEVISAEEEAQLAFKSVQRHFALEERSIAVVDIGGGSIEVILVADGVINQVHTLPLGAVRLTEEHYKSDPLEPKHWKKLRRAIDASIEETVGRPPMATEVMVGSGGTFTNLGEMAQCDREGRATQIRGYVMSRADLARLLDRLRETPLGARRRLCGLNPKRADIIVAGAAAVARLARHLGTQRIVINDRGIRDGLLISMVEDICGGGAADRQPVQDRMEWVREFARKCRSNERHCNHVAELALQIFDGLCGPYELPTAGRDIVQAAAVLHDVGYLINHARHHKHAYHLIMHGDLRGFSPGEVELIANVARYHRRAFPKRSHENFRRLDKGDRELVRQLSGILRVAEGLDRTHGQVVTGVWCDLGDGSLRMLLQAAENPAVELADAERKAGLFETVFGVRLLLEWTGARARGKRPVSPPGRATDRRTAGKRS